MKIKKNHFERNFSNQFDNLTLKKVINERLNIKKHGEVLLNDWNENNCINGGYNGDSNLIDLFSLLFKFEPQRYIWHVSYPHARMSIAEKGIIVDQYRRKYGVWANNNNRIDQFYPWAVDGPWGPQYDAVDFWRIDTWKANTEWRMDPYMHAWSTEIDAVWEERKRYVCTLNNIPTSAIKLYEYEQRFYSDEPMKYYEMYLESVNTSNLKPVHEINKLIKNQNRSAVSKKYNRAA